MAPAKRRAALERGAIALLVRVASGWLAMSAFAYYGRSQLHRVEELFLGELEALTLAPVPSSAESLEYTERLLAAAERVTEDWPHLEAAYHDRSPALLERIAPQLEVFLGAAEVAPAHETLESGRERGVGVLRAARLPEPGPLA